MEQSKEQFVATDYLQLYLECEGEVMMKYGQEEQIVKCTLVGINKHKGTVILLCMDIYGNRWNCFSEEPEHQFKPILRPLSDMTKDELEIFEKLTRLHPLFDEDGIYEMSEEILNNTNPKTFQYTLSKHFDLFGLIPAGLAIDATTINNQNLNQ